MELDHQETGPEEDYDRVRQACCSHGWWRGHETEPCQTRRWERRVKGWERRAGSMCVHLCHGNSLDISRAVLFHRCRYWQRRGEGGEDLSVARAAGQTPASSQMSLHRHASGVTHINIYTHFLPLKVNRPLASQGKESKNKLCCCSLVTAPL